jgi:hypothetical protein
MNPRIRNVSRGAFTLVELVVATALTAFVLGAAYACMLAGFSTRKTIEPRSDRFQAARVTLGLLTADLRSACPMHKGPEFLGSPGTEGTVPTGKLDFATHHFTPRREGEGDYACVSWFVEDDPATGESVLWRRRNPGIGPDPLTGGRREEILRPVEGFDLEFYDGLDWHETWGDPNGRAKQESSFRDRPNLVGMPTAVRITLSLPGEPASESAAGATPPPIVFEAVVRIAVESTGGSSTGGNAAGPGAGQNPATPSQDGSPQF